MLAQSSFIGDRVIVFHNTEFVPALPHPAIGVSGAWDWGAMIGLALTEVNTEYVFIEHDDIAYSDADVRILLAGAQAKSAVLAFPNVNGPDASWQQKLEVKGISDCFSYSSDCAMLVRTDFLRKHLRLGMKGKGFHAGYLQLCAREELATTIVVHGAKVLIRNLLKATIKTPHNGVMNQTTEPKNKSVGFLLIVS